MRNPLKLLTSSRDQRPSPAKFPGFKRDPFAAIPVRHKNAEHREDSHGCFQIRLRLEPAPGVSAYLARKLGFQRDVRVGLDRQGSFFWSQVDGQQDLRAIEGKIRDTFSLSQEQSQRATLLFTRMLMLRHLILLDLGEDLLDAGGHVTEEPQHVR